MSTQLIKPNYLVILPPTQHHSFFRNLPPLFVCFSIKLDKKFNNLKRKYGISELHNMNNYDFIFYFSYYDAH